MDDYLLSLVRPDQQQIWIGKAPPFAIAALDLLASTNFRAAAAHHTRYNVVWFYRKMLSDVGRLKWRLVLDECVRMLGDSGQLVLRFRQNHYISIINVKQFLGRRVGVTCSVDYERNTDGVFTVVFSVVRENAALYRDKSWSFVLLARGDRTENAIAFLRSVRSQDPDYRHQILIVGPVLPEYEPFSVVGHPENYREELAELGKKKNDAAALVSGSNVLIAHDRYVLDDQFFSGFDIFGYDFDLVAVRQIFRSGEEYPFYGAIDARELVWAQPIHSTDYNSLLPGQFVNGGLMVFKTHALRQIGFNNLLFWNQGEDLELTQEFIHAGLPPRVNVHSTAVTNVPDTYTMAFRRRGRLLRRVKLNNAFKGLVLSAALSGFALLPLSARNRIISVMKKKGFLYHLKRHLLS